MSDLGKCTPEMNEYLKWRGLPSIHDYIEAHLVVAKAYELMAVAQASGFENKDALKQASALFFDVVRKTHFIQAYVGLGYLSLLVDQKENAVKYLAVAQTINPLDEDTKKLLDHALAERPDLASLVRPVSFKDDEHLGWFISPISPDNRNRLEELPSELLVLVFDWLTPRSVAKFRQGNKFFRDLLVNNVYWQDKINERWSIHNIEGHRRTHKDVPADQLYFHLYRLHHTVNVNWLNRTTEFTAIKKTTGRAAALYMSPQHKIFVSPQGEPSSLKRGIEFFRYRKGNFHRMKRICIDFEDNGNFIAATNSNDTVMTFWANGTFVATDVEKRESKVHLLNRTVTAAAGLKQNGIKFLAGSIFGFSNQICLVHGTDVVKTCNMPHYIHNISLREDNNMALVTTNALTDSIQLVDMETFSVVDQLSLPEGSTLKFVQYLDNDPNIIMGATKTQIKFADLRTKNRYELHCPKTQPSVTRGLVLDSMHLLALSDTCLTLFDCRYSISICQAVALPKNHQAVDGLALYDDRKVLYSSSDNIVEWDMSKIINVYEDAVEKPRHRRSF